jgi:hypothetical protein
MSFERKTKVHSPQDFEEILMKFQRSKTVELKDINSRISELVLETNDHLEVSKGDSTWKNYVSFVHDEVLCGLSCSIISSVDILILQMETVEFFGGSLQCPSKTRDCNRICMNVGTPCATKRHQNFKFSETSLFACSPFVIYHLILELSGILSVHWLFDRSDTSCLLFLQFALEFIDGFHCRLSEFFLLGFTVEFLSLIFTDLTFPVQSGDNDGSGTGVTMKW